jgi:Cytochrome P450
MERLPALRVMVKEVLRWRPVTASGIPHMTTKEDIHEGLWIPQGTNRAGESMVGDLPCTRSLKFQLQVLALAQRDTILTLKNNPGPFTVT